MEHKKIVNVPAKKIEQVDYYTCDICGINLSDVHYEVSEVDISMKEGVSYPDSGHHILTEFDICITCFKEKLMKFMSDNGAKPRISEIDW
jgi:hypothetical protein